MRTDLPGVGHVEGHAALPLRVVEDVIHRLQGHARSSFSLHSTHNNLDHSDRYPCVLCLIGCYVPHASSPPYMSKEEKAPRNLRL
jgi:hypothetical protein